VGGGRHRLAPRLARGDASAVAGSRRVALEGVAVGPVEREPDRRVAANREPSLVYQRVVMWAEEDAVVHGRLASVSEVDDVMDVARATPATGEATSRAIAHPDRSTLRSAPHGCAPSDVERLAPASHEMADAAVTGHAADRLETDRRAVDELSSPGAIHQRVDVGNEVQRVSIGIWGARWRVEPTLAGSNEIEQRIHTTLTEPRRHGFS